MNGTLRLLSRCIYDKEQCLFYRAPGQRPEACADGAVTVYRRWEDIPPEFRRAVVPKRWMSVLYYRLRRGEAKLLCLSEKPTELRAYGWIQSWRPFRRKFSMVASEGVMLGPYRTTPAERGRGLYVRLLRHSLHLCQNEQSIVIYTSPGNIPSQKGITRAGFEFIGAWEVEIWCRVLIRRRQLSS